MDAWFMGTTSVEPGVGGAIRTVVPGFTMESTITVWEPGRRLVHVSPEGEDGRIMTFAMEIQSREGGRAWVRFVHSGFLAGDDWEDEYDALRTGDPAFIHKLAQVLRHFKGRRAVPIFVVGPQITATDAPSAFATALGLATPVAEGDAVRVSLDDLPPVVGVVDYVSRDFLGVLSDDALYRFVHGLGGATVLEHHFFGDVDGARLEAAWIGWLLRAFG
jgi:hypothetical protein